MIDFIAALHVSIITVENLATENIAWFLCIFPVMSLLLCLVEVDFVILKRVK